MDIRYNYFFEGYGQIINESGIQKNEIWLDVGNSLEMGRFDHHRSKQYQSALAALVANFKYLDDARECAKNGIEIHVHMHENPDMDCVASLYVAKKYLELSDDEFNNFKENNVAGLVEYVNGIDMGKGKITDYPTLYALFDSISREEENNFNTYLKIIDKGTKLLDIALEAKRKDNSIELTTHNFAEYVGEEFKGNVIDLWSEYYEKEKKNNKISFVNVNLWTKGEKKLAEARAAIWTDCSEYDYPGYNFARKKEGVELTAYPYSVKGKNGAETTRVIVSLNPDNGASEKYTLKPIAEIVEQLEQLEEQILYEKTGSYRRDRSRPREGNGEEESDETMKTLPFSVTSDPWCCKPMEDIFDAPHAQSLIDYNNIIELITRNASTVRRSFTAEIYSEGDTPVKINLETNRQINEWFKETRERINTEKSDKEKHFFVYAELDASLICHSNKLLETYCLNLAGRSVYDLGSKEIIHIDYRTCMYCDVNCTIVLVGRYENQPYDDLRISSFLNAEDFCESNLKTSGFIDMLGKIYRQRLKLLGYGDQIKELKQNKKTKQSIESINNELLGFSMETLIDSGTKNQVEREINNYLRKEFQIDELYSAVMDEINILVTEARNRTVSIFNNLMSFAAPFILVATLFQMGIVKFEGLELTGIAAGIGWVITVLIIVLVVLWLLDKTKKDK